MKATAAILPHLVNASPLLARAIPFLVKSPCTAVIVKGSWSVQPGGALRPLEPAMPLALLDQPAGEPGKSSTRYESDLVPYKPRADLLCVGRAYANRGKPGPGCVAAFGVGGRLKQIQVIGNRIWKASMGGRWNSPTEPEPFVEMAVTFENAFGGRDPADAEKRRYFAANPFGKGYASNEQALGGLPLPNLEDPANRMKGPGDQPPPRCFGPVGRTWTPRISLAGTYDKRWTEPKEPPPLIPEDFDEGFFNCAPADQQVQGYLKGDETVRAVNLHPLHSDLTFQLPKLQVRCLADRVRGGVPKLEDVPAALDTLWLDMEALTLVLVWRARLQAAAAGGVERLLVIAEPTGLPPSPPESHRGKFAELDVDEAGEADLEPPEPEPADESLSG